MQKEPNATTYSSIRQRNTRRIPREKARLLVAIALRNLNKLPILEESELIDLLDIHGDGKGYWPRASILREKIKVATNNVIEKLADEPAFNKHCQLLAAVLSGDSISAFAAQQGVSRELISRSLWKVATDFVRKELFS